MSAEIYWDDLTPEKQQEILEVFGENCNFDAFPIVELSVEPEMDEPFLQM